MVIEHGKVSRARPSALSNSMVLDPDLIHCSMVSSKIRAFLDTGTSEDPTSGRKSGFSSRVLWQGLRFALARKKMR